MGNADRQRAYRQRRREQPTVTDHTSTPTPISETVSPLDDETTSAQENHHVSTQKSAAVAEPVPYSPPQIPRCSCCGSQITWILAPGARRPRWDRPGG